MDELFSAEEIKASVLDLATRVNEVMGDRSDDEPLLIVAILEGAMRFAMDMQRALETMACASDVTSLGLSSYGSGKTSGVISVTSEIPLDLRRRKILLLDDIADTGQTLRFAKGYLAERGPESILIAVLLDKQKLSDDLRAELEPLLSGLICPDRFVIGYGMDLDGAYRDLDVIAALD